MSEYKKTKYEATIKLIARLMTEGQYKNFTTKALIEKVHRSRPNFNTQI